MTFTQIVTDARKAVTALSGAVGEAVTLGFLHGDAERYATGAIAIATAALVYLVPNGKKTATP